MDTKIIEEELNGWKFKFQTKAGIFSKNGIDSGTRLLLANLAVKDGTVIADLGAGTGVIGFVIARLNYNGHVHLLEDHVRSFELLQENVGLNRLKNVEIFLSDLFSAVGDRSYHQIYSNPPQQLGNDFLEELVTECFGHLKNKGEVFLVVKNNIKPVMEKFMKNIFKNCKIVARNKEYVVLKGVRES